MEGVGEEVVYTFGFLLLLLVAFIIWRMSYVMEPSTTHVAHPIVLNRPPINETNTPIEASSSLNRNGISEEDHPTSISPEQSSNPSVPTQSESLQAPAQPSGPLVTIRIKFLDERTHLVQTSLSETLGAFRRKHLAAEITPTNRVRLIFNGHELV